MEQLDDEDERENYNFDFHALSKLKRREKMKVFLLSILVVLLLIILLVVSALYHKEVNKKMKSPLKMKEVETGKLTAQKYGENCYLETVDHTQCVENAYCRDLQGTYRCDCKEGFAGDGKGHCNDINFLIDFRTRTTKNLPEVKRVHFPKTNELSVCFWFQPAALDRKWSAFFLYTTVEIEHGNEFMMWLNKKQEIHVTMRNRHQLVLKKKNSNIRLNSWTHLCWTWNSTGQWSIYLSGKHVNTGYKASMENFKGVFPDSMGSLMLGQDKDHDRVNDRLQMFRGKITQFYVYKKQLNVDEVYSAYQLHPSTQHLILGWWQFKNTTNGTDIVTTRMHNDLLDLNA